MCDQPRNHTTSLDARGRACCHAEPAPIVAEERSSVSDERRAVDSYDLSGPEAWHSLQDNPGARWASGLQQTRRRERRGSASTQGRSSSRCCGRSSAIDRNDRIFAIGSCFARNVEASLKALGFTVDSLTDALDEFSVDAPRNTPIGYMNKYNAESIYNELRWALTDTGFPTEALVPREDGSGRTRTRARCSRHGTKELMLRRHGIMTDVVRRVSECRIVVITLGLVETFLDTYTGLYTNCTPTVSAQKDRFRFRVLSYERGSRRSRAHPCAAGQARASRCPDRRHRVAGASRRDLHGARHRGREHVLEVAPPRCRRSLGCEPRECPLLPELRDRHELGSRGCVGTRRAACPMAAGAPHHGAVRAAPMSRRKSRLRRSRNADLPHG